MKTVSRAYDTYAQARAAVAAVEAAGVPSAEVSLVANKYVSAQYADVDDVNKTATGAGIGGVVGGGAGLLAGLGLLAIPGLGPVVAAGWLAATAVGVAAGATAGGLVGALVGAGESEEHANVYSESVRRGGTLVTARVADQDASRIQIFSTDTNRSIPRRAAQIIVVRGGSLLIPRRRLIDLATQRLSAFGGIGLPKHQPGQKAYAFCPF